MRTSKNIVLESKDLQERVKHALRFGDFTFDVETMGENRLAPSKNRVVWISVATHGMGFAVPMGHPNGDRLIKPVTKKLNKETRKFEVFPAVYDEPPKQLRPSTVFDILEPLFFSERRKNAHNGPFDLGSVAKYYDDEIPPPPYSDTTVMQWLLDENLRQYKLKPLIDKHYGAKYDPRELGKQIELHPFTPVGRYSYMDSKYTHLLGKKLRKEFPEQNLETVLRLEEDLIGVLIDMSLEGAPVDVATLEQLREELSERVVETEGKIYKAAGKKFNINSAPQKCEVLYAPKEAGGQGLKPWMLTEGGEKKEKKGQELKYSDYSTKDVVLERYVSNILAKNLLDYAELNKLLGTYILGYLGVEGNPKKPCRIIDGRIHADLVQYGTVTGRFSCREPNLQNIPRPDTELGKKIRGLFVAPSDMHRLVVADYGQIEMVLLAHFAGPGALFHGIQNGMDPHSATAAALAGIDAQTFMDMVRNEDPEAKKMRQVAKGVNFAVVYGAGAAKVAAMAKVTETEAKRFLNIHQRQFPEIYEFKDDVVDRCRQRRPAHIKTLLGRRRRLPAIFSKDDGLRKYTERQAVNSLVQGSAADVIKMAMVRLNATLEEDMRLILSVHDELATIAPLEKAERCEQIVKEAMLGDGIQRLVNVPLTADVKSVYRWSEAK